MKWSDWGTWGPAHWGGLVARVGTTVNMLGTRQTPRGLCTGLEQVKKQTVPHRENRLLSDGGGGGGGGGGGVDEITFWPLSPPSSAVQSPPATGAMRVWDPSVLLD
jgi:hypothetical protein